MPYHSEMSQFPRARIVELLSLAEQQAPNDPESELAARMFRSLLEPAKPKDLLREDLQEKLSDYALAIFDEDSEAIDHLAHDIRCRLASYGLQPKSLN